MFLNSEAKRENDFKVLQGFFSEYEMYKQYIEDATEQEKLTPMYTHRTTIVEGVDKIYPALTDDMKKIVHMRYWYKDYQSDWSEIADELHMTVSRTKRFNDLLFCKFKEAIGWV